MASNNPTRHSPERNLERGDGNRAEGSLRPGSAGDHHRQEARFRQHFHDSQREASGSSGINTGNTVTDMIVSNLLTQGATFEQCRRYVAVFKGEAVGLQPKTPAEKQGLTEQQLSVENLIDDALQGVPQTRPYQASASQADISSSPQVNAPSSSQQLFPQTDTGSQTNRPHTESTADIVNRYMVILDHPGRRWNWPALTEEQINKARDEFKKLLKDRDITQSQYVTVAGTLGRTKRKM